MTIDDVRDTLRCAAAVALPPDMASKVIPLRADPARLKSRAKGLLKSVTWARDIKPNLDRRYLVKGWLDQGAVSVLYGPSNGGKSFLAVDIAHHLAKGLAWAGRRVNKSRVLYIAAEGGSAFANRVAALHEPDFWVLQIPLTLTGAESSASPLAEMMQHLAAVGGKFEMIIIDTMARVMGGRDENAAPDIVDLMRNIDLLRRATGAHVMLVHHTGKDTGRGALGHSSLRAAIDTEIELSRDDEAGVITAEVTKQRDGPTGYKFTYHLRQVEIGRDQDDDPVTTCLVEPTDPAQAGRVVLSEAARNALGILYKMLTEGGEFIRSPN